jgi:hypothetical protein
MPDGLGDMNFKEREALLDEDVAMDDLTQDYDSAFHTFPPGEEGMFMSHAGGEEEVLEDIICQYRSTKYVFCYNLQQHFD